ncbi:uncharacterized protein LOC124937702 [Impatiens glandulifera]|uniref:uncharacterized protein LOC124937702 n=1 Tax=Impatiens glandulifera TaxID=253017 RepID=UPI001FB057E2|nr:uncharacterized protein LOC124937702 [Impatiens glandulifera]
MGGGRGGGYVGGFLQMFDWNSKSRKKLFAGSKSNFLVPDQKKRTEQNLPTTHEEEEEDEATNYSCSSSVINEEDDHGYRIKTTNVVARLMGLDSLPTSNFEEEKEEETPISLGDKQEKVDNLVQRAINKQQTPVEKFQAEILPRKTAKSIPITQNKLLSPIKSPSFVPSYKDAAQIMEAVSKIIEPALQANSTSKKVIKLQLPSVPLKTKDLKEKATAASIGCSSSSRRRMRSCSNFNSDSDKEKSVSLAIQAKVNVQRREGISRQSSNNISIQPNKNNNTQKKKTSSTVVLRQNNQKQNCRPTEKDNNYKSTSHGRRRSVLTLDDSSSNSSLKVNSRKFDHDDEDDKQSVSSSSSSITKTVSRKKQLIATDKRNDIVSFTFTTPMRSGITTPMAFEKTDDLTALLEQKLKEITNMVQSCKHNPQDREMDLSGTSRTKLWELEYVKEILSGVEFMIEDYVIGRSKRIINPQLFHQIESPIRGEDQSKKLLFDCVGESMELRCMSGRGWKAALSFGRSIRRRKTLAEEVYGEISGWRGAGIGKGGKEEEDRMVDDLVDRDMSSQYGKWIDFEIEIFQIGVEIQGQILNTLINQVIADMIASSSYKL